MFKWLLRWKASSSAQIQILRALQAGWTLKSHRYLDGDKIYRLHSLDGEQIDLPNTAVDPLIQRRWIHSNQKFPAATFLITDAGRAALKQVGHDDASAS